MDSKARYDAPGAKRMKKFSPHVGLFEELSEGKHSSTLGDKFLLPPFTVLNAREGWWQDRKRAWLELGIKSELGRGGDGSETTLGAIAPNEKTIMGRTGSYATAGLYTLQTTDVLWYFQPLSVGVTNDRVFRPSRSAKGSEDV